MYNIIETGDRIILHTSMSDREFAKANMMQHMKATGYIAKETDDGSFEFSEWFFEDTATDENGEFSLSSSGFNGTTAYEILKEVEESCKGQDICTKPNQTQINVWPQIFRIIKAMRDAETQAIRLPICGAIGIICAEDGRILFLPELLVTRSVAMRSQEEAAEYTESWRQSILPIEQIPAFSAAIMIYTVLTGRRPFNAKSPENLSEDFLDSYFVNSEYACSIAKEKADILNNALKGKLKFRPTLKRLLTIFDRDLNSLYLSETKTSTADAKNKFCKKQNSRIAKNRYFRHHFTQISIAGIITVIVAICVISFINSERERPNTKGLTSFQVVESFYSSLNHLDTIPIDECLSKKAGKEIKEITSSIYVTSKMQSAYNYSAGFLTPAQWIIKASPNKANVFGITQLKINGQKGCSSADWFENNQKIPLDIQEGTKEYFEVEYYLLITEDPESITIFTYKDNLELTFAKKKWLISSLERNFTTDYCDKAKFFEDLANNDTDGYIWFPSAEELEFGKTELAALEAPLF